MINNIIFDFGGVILKHKSTLLEDKISQIFSVPFNEASNIWKKWKPIVMTGKVSSKQFLNEVKKELNSNKPISELLLEWREIYIREAQEVNWELLDFIKELKKSYHVYLLTDTIDTHDEYNLDRGIYDKFNGVFRSHIEGLSKLNDDAFINVLKKTNARADECVFIDDLEANVKRAENLDMKGIVYKNKEKLKQELSRLGCSV